MELFSSWHGVILDITVQSQQTSILPPLALHKKTCCSYSFQAFASSSLWRTAYHCRLFQSRMYPNTEAVWIYWPPRFHCQGMLHFKFAYYHPPWYIFPKTACSQSEWWQLYAFVRPNILSPSTFHSFKQTNHIRVHRETFYTTEIFVFRNHFTQICLYLFWNLISDNVILFTGTANAIFGTCWNLRGINVCKLAGPDEILPSTIKPLGHLLAGPICRLRNAISLLEYLALD